LIQNDKTMLMHLYFSDIFRVPPKVLDKYGAFNISLVTDLPKNISIGTMTKYFYRKRIL